MDLDNPSLLLSGVLVSALGMGFFLYGKKTQDLWSLLYGVLLLVVPFFAGSMLVMWGAAGIGLVLFYMVKRVG